MFNNQSLASVFRQLEEMYNVDIVYAKKDVAKMYFIGKFNKDDSVETILQNIATLNNLKLTKESNTYIIRK
jgi:ferric-dicitrate binding protein FerR (iron transport regulator)